MKKDDHLRSRPCELFAHDYDVIVDECAKDNPYDFADQSFDNAFLSVGEVLLRFIAKVFSDPFIRGYSWLNFLLLVKMLSTLSNEKC